MMSNKQHFRLHHCAGVGLVEILIAVTISLFLVGGIIQVLTNNKSTYRLQQGLARVQESARFAVELLSRDVRMAGFIPCASSANIANTINITGTASDWWADFTNAAIRGYEGGSSSIPSNLSTTGTSPGDHIANTDILVTLKGSSTTYNITSHNPTSANFKVSALHDLVDGDILMVCDPQNTGIFQVTSVNSNNVTVVHNTGTGTPGNCSKKIKGNGNCNSTAGLISSAYGKDATIVKFESHAYYIGVSQDGLGRSLYRTRLTASGGTSTLIKQELVEGIENMQVLYGINKDSDPEPERYVSASVIETEVAKATPAFTWNDVNVVRVGLLVQTPSDVNTSNDTTTYTVAGTSIGTSGTVTHAADRKLRYVVNLTIKIRNRGAN